MGTKNNPGAFDCYDNAEPDEPMFVLLARDPLASELVERWANQREATRGPSPKVDEARACARAMREWGAMGPWRATREEAEADATRDAVVETPRACNEFAGIDPRSPEGHLRSVLWELLGGMGAESVESAAQRVVSERNVARIERDVLRARADGDPPAPCMNETSTWPPRDVVRKLADAVNHLLFDHDCDAHGHEELARARDEARVWLGDVDLMRLGRPCPLPIAAHPYEAGEGGDPRDESCTHHPLARCAGCQEGAPGPDPVAAYDAWWASRSPADRETAMRAVEELEQHTTPASPERDASFAGTIERIVDAVERARPVGPGIDGIDFRARVGDALRAFAAEAATVRAAELDATLGRLESWTRAYGAELVPPGVDSYGEGVRDAKERVRRILRGDMHGETPKESKP